MAQLAPAQQQAMVAASPLQAEYGTTVDRDSAYEMLLAKVAPAPEEAPEPAAPTPRQEPERPDVAIAGGALATVLGSSLFKSFARSAASAAGREITRDLFGTAPRRRATRRRR
jgi:hypothetical protein